MDISLLWDGYDVLNILSRGIDIKMKILKLDKQGIYEYQQDREPYLMIDEATEVVPGVSSKGFKDFKNDEWFFKVHWKNDPNVPGMLQIESLVQMAALSILIFPEIKVKLYI